MANKIEVVIQHALRTFRKPLRKLPECSQTELNELRSLMNEITARDIHKLRGLLKSGDLKEFLRRKKTTLDYLSVYEDDNISVGVFLLRQGAKLPIHDHPEMYGIIKVLQGVLKITSYSLIDIDTTTHIHDHSLFYNHPLRVRKHPEVLLDNKDNCCLLTPTDKNIHEVECIEGPAAFLDVLSPPYENGDSNEPRTCHYFEELDAEDVDDSEDTHPRLLQIPSPF